MEVPRYWRQRKQRYSMVGEVCPSCKSHVFPPRDVCPYCSEANRQNGPVVEHQAVLSFAQPVAAVKR